jgi:hypothetical protein
MAVIGDAWETAAPQASRSLSTEHRDYLRNESGLTDEIIDTRGYYTLSRASVQALVSLEVVHPYVQQAEAWLGIPIFRPDSTKHGEIVRVFGGTAKSKYVWPTGSRAAFDVHPAGWPYILDRDTPILVTEGVKKADALLAAARAASFPCLVVALNGCWGWRSKIEGASVGCPDILDIAWEERRVYVISDSDFRTNDDVRRGWTECALYLASKTGSGRCSLVVVPPSGTEKQGADDYLVAGNSLDALLSLAQSPKFASTEVDRERPPISVKSGMALIREAGDRIPHIYEPMIPERAVMLMTGHSGTYKTWHGLSLILDAAFGFPWLDHPGLKMRGTPVKSLYVNKEMSGSILGQRLKAMARASRYKDVPDYETVIDERVHFVDETALDLNSLAHRERLEEAVLQCGATLVILDSLSMCWHGDENSSTEVGALYDQLRGITERTGVTWVILHHLLKPQGGRKKEHAQFEIRGSGQLYQQADAVIMLRHYITDKAEDDVKQLGIYHIKARTSEEMPSFIARFSANDGLYVTLTYSSAIVEAKAAAYAASAGDPAKLADWIETSVGGMPAMLPSGPGLRFKQLHALLKASWSAGGSAPSEQSIRRQLKDMVDAGELVCLERSSKHGDLYRLTEVPEMPEIPLDIPEIVE